MLQPERKHLAVDVVVVAVVTVVVAALARKNSFVKFCSKSVNADSFTDCVS